MRHLPSLVLVFVLVFGLAPLLRPDTAGAEDVPLTRLPLSRPVETRDQWYGLYVFGQKAGWAREGIRQVGTGRAGLFVVTVRMRFEIQAMGQAARSEYGMLLAFDASPPYALRRARSLQIDTHGRQTVRLDAGPDGATAVVTQGAETRILEPDPVDYTLEDYLSTTAWIRSRPAVGDVLRVRDYDVDELEADVNTYEVAERKETVAHGVPVTCWDLTVASQREGEQGVVRMDAEGRMVSLTMGTMLELRLEPEEIARRLEIGADLFRLGTARVAGRIGDPTTVRELVLEVHGEGASALPDGPRQTVERDADTGAVRIRLGRAHGRRYEATPEEVAEALRETVELPIRHPEVLALARRAVGDAGTDAERVARLVEFVSKHVKDAVSVNAPTVLELVRDGRGDCSEHALLLTALARAIGIPAREVSGLMYMGDGEQAFGGHAWNEVVLDGAWVQVDATWNQPEVDATHITLSRTERDQSVQFRAFGGLRFVVREVVHE